MATDVFSVAGRVAVITGGLGQLGAEFAIAFADRGAKVVVLDLTDDARAVEKAYGKRASDSALMFAAADVTDRGALASALNTVEKKWGVPNVLINCAALDSPPDAPAEVNGPFENYPEEVWDKILDVNLKGVFLCCQIFGGRMASAGSGSVINISSIYGLVSPNHSIYEYRQRRGENFFKPVAYAASKSGLLNLTRYLATYWAPRGVRVNTLTLAGVFNNQDEEFLRSYTPHLPLGRMASPADYVGPLLFLSSDASSYMTGANLVVDGGWTAW